MSYFGDSNNCYDQAPTGYDPNSPNSEDSTDTINEKPQFHINKTPSPTLFGNNSPTEQSTFTFPDTTSPQLTQNISINSTIGNAVSYVMPSFGSKSSTNGHGHNIMDKYKTAKTQKLPLKISEIVQGPTEVTQRQKIAGDIFCGNYIFDIGFYIKKDQTVDDNQFVITIEHKKRNLSLSGSSRKRKRDDQDMDGTASKKRRLNTNNESNQTQSYSNGNGHGSSSSLYSSDSNVGDRIGVSFTINYSGPSSQNNEQPLIKTQSLC